MAKNNFLLVDLEDAKIKKLANTITSDTSRKILNYLTEKEDTETKISEELGLPISTVHYHLQKLKEAGLVIVEEFHYSKKGREVNHYKLANKYIIIAPKKVSGLKEKLQGILPVGLVVLGISAVIKVVSMFTGRTATFQGAKMMAAPAMESAEEAAPRILMDNMEEPVMNCIQQSSLLGDVAFSFLVGGLVAISLYVLYQIVKEKRNKK
jgi:DNA-binding transcriptional ArsR family regulator